MLESGLAERLYTGTWLKVESGLRRTYPAMMVVSVPKKVGVDGERAPYESMGSMVSDGEGLCDRGEGGPTSCLKACTHA